MSAPNPTPEEMPPEQSPGPQASAQWAVRWFAIVFVALLCASVPLVHLIWHGLLGRDEPAIRTRAQKVAPVATVTNVQSGDWMLKKQRELQEASPITWWLRGHYNELRYRLDVPQSARVHFGAGEGGGDEDWFFIKTSIRPNNRGFARATKARRKFLAGVRDVVRAAGAEFLMVVIPDKARVYADVAFADGALPANKKGNYGRILAELQGLGIDTMDMATPMRAARAAVPSDEPGDQLFYARDTHWRPAGALVGGQLIAGEIERRYGKLLGPRRVARLNGPTKLRAVGDLTAMLGILSIVQPDPVTGQRTVALSLLSDQLAEERNYFGVDLVDGAASVPMYGDDPNAEVLLIGTSFSEENGMSAISFTLGRAIRGHIIRGAQGMKPLQAALRDLRAAAADGAAPKPKLVVWEMVERGWFEGAWLDPKLP
ncbi:MAG: hypothetical protein AB8H80_14340 [Planctomycetota bacterium]